MSRRTYRVSAGVSSVAILIALAVVLYSKWNGADRAAEFHPEPSRSTNRDAADGKPPIQVATVRPTVADFRHTTSQPAHVEPYEQTDIYAKASGFVAKVLADIGDRVEKDQVLAELWIPELDQERLASAALLEEAKAAMGQASANLHAADAMVKAAAAAVRETEATIAKYEADVKYRESEHRRFDQLAKERAVHESLAYEKLNQLEGAKAALVAAQAGVESAHANVDVEIAKQVQAKSNLAHAEARLKVAEAKLRQSEIMVAYTKVRAPYAAIVSQRLVDTGDFVTSPTGSKTQPLFTATRVDVLRIIADIPEAESALVRVGQPVSLVVDALKGRTFAGRVKRTTGVLEPTAHKLRIEAELDQSQPDLRPGMFGMLTVTLADRRQATLIPAKCLVYRDGRPFVSLVVDGRVQQRTIKIGFSDGNRAEILDGVSPSDDVILEPTSQLTPGHPVRVARSR